MTTVPRFDTDEVFNQSPPYENIDLFGSDLPLKEAVEANGGGGETAALSAFGRQWGTAEMLSLARRANENPPKLYTFDPKGFRRDVVEFHPAYHDLMRTSIAAGLHCSTWQSSGERKPPPAEVARSARYYMTAQIESGHLCPITMTRAALAALAAAPSLLARNRGEGDVDQLRPAFRPWWEKSGHDARHGHDREAGRHRRARQFHHRDAVRRGLFDHRSQVVFVRTDVRRFLGAGAGARRTDLFLRAALSARRRRSTVCVCSG